MKKLNKMLLSIGLLTLFSACTTVEQNLLDANSLLLSNREVKEIFSGNSITSTTGETFYFDPSGKVAGKAVYGELLKGNWNITDDGRLCLSNWNSPTEAGGCFKVYFDNKTQQRRLTDLNGDLKYTIMNVVTGNPNNF